LHCEKQQSLRPTLSKAHSGATGDLVGGSPFYLSLQTLSATPSGKGLLTTLDGQLNNMVSWRRRERGPPPNLIGVSGMGLGASAIRGLKIGDL